MTAGAGSGAGARESALLRALVEAVEAETGEAFFRSLVRHLAEGLGVAYAFVSELTQGGTHFRSLALWARGAPGPDFELPLRGTPCEAVLGGCPSHHPRALQQRFPADAGLADWRAESYAGVPIFDAAGSVVGHFAVMHDRPLEDGARALALMGVFAARVRAELGRLRTEAALRASEERLERIVASAADGIIVSDAEGTIQLFNPAAERILRCTAKDAIGSSVYRFGTEEGAAARRAAMEQLERTPGALVFYGEEDGVLARRADGSLFLHEGSLSRGEVAGRPVYTVIFRDCEERRAFGREMEAIQLQNQYLREELQSLHNFEEIVGRSSALRAAFDELALVAATDATVLIQGETGTGKELFARAIHARSARKDRPLVKLNCAAMAPGLVESELFGHEKGAFTGASERRIGRFELAHGGTLFLDEVGEIPLETQAKLLRVLQEREFERAGGSTTLQVDVRVIAATNRDLVRAVADGKFREDLYYRLNVFPLVLPPLRERRGDVALLAQFFLDRHSAKIGRRITSVSRATLERLEAYPWPGNVRELENVIERAVILSRGAELEVSPALLPPARPTAAAAPPPAAVPLHTVPGSPGTPLESVEREHILRTLRETGWRIDGPGGAARLLGLHPSTLRSRIKRLGISRSRDAAS